MSSRHPSFYALDRARLGLPLGAEAQAHLAGCAACAAHLRATAEPPLWLTTTTTTTAATTAATAVATGPAAAGPSRATGPARAAAGPARTSWRAPLWWRRWALFVPLAAAAAMVLVVWGRPEPDQVRAKGTPGVTVFLKRGDQVVPWEPGRALEPGDRLRLRLAGAGYQHVSVASLPPDRPPAVLYEGLAEPAAALLPLSFRVDDQGGQERLSIVLGRRPVPPALHTGRDQGRDEANDVWHQILTFDKRSPR